MSIPIGSEAQYFSTANMLNTSSSAKSIENTLNNSSATDEELMESCKSFESYLLEQVFKGMEKTVMKDESEKENDYMAQFGDKLYENYAQEATKGQGFGLAQMLYESMKRNS